jgi:general secretion pathway protein L
MSALFSSNRSEGSNPSAKLPTSGGLVGWLPQPVQHFWRWWVAELRPVFTPLVARYWVDHANAIDLKLDAQGELPTQLPANGNFTGRDVRVLLDRESALIRTVSYPAVVEENLADVVINDLDRQTPFKPEQVYCTQRVVRRFDSADGVARIDVEITIVTRRVADAALQRVREKGGSVYSLALIAGGNAGNNTLELLPESARPARRLSTLQKMNVALAIALGVILLAAIIVPIYLKREQAIALQPLVEKAKSEAEITRKIEAEYQRLQQEYQFAAGKKYAMVPTVDIVEALTKLSPDTTWLRSLELKTQPAPKSVANGATAGAPTPRTRELLLMGEATSAAKMIELFEQSPLFQNTTQRAQARRNANNLDEFQIATELKPRVLPEMVSVLDGTSKTATAAAKPAAATTNEAAPAITTAPTPAATNSTATVSASPVASTKGAATVAPTVPAAAPPIPPAATSLVSRPSSPSAPPMPPVMPMSSNGGAPIPLPPGIGGQGAPNMPMPPGASQNMPLPPSITPQNTLPPPQPPPQPAQPAQPPQEPSVIPGGAKTPGRK